MEENALSAATEHLSSQERLDQGSHDPFARALLVKPKAIKVTICLSAPVLQGVLLVSCSAFKVQPEVSTPFLEAVTLNHCCLIITDTDVCKNPP